MRAGTDRLCRSGRGAARPAREASDMTSVSIKIVSLDAQRRAKRRERIRAPFKNNGSAKTLHEARQMLIGSVEPKPRMADFASALAFGLAREIWFERRLAKYHQVIFGDNLSERSRDD